jgi:hypothetical protein
MLPMKYSSFDVKKIRRSSLVIKPSLSLSMYAKALNKFCSDSSVYLLDAAIKNSVNVIFLSLLISMFLMILAISPSFTYMLNFALKLLTNSLRVISPSLSSSSTSNMIYRLSFSFLSIIFLTIWINTAF